MLVLAVLLLSTAPFELLLPKQPMNGIVRDRVTSEPIVGARVHLGPVATRTDSGGAFAVPRASLADAITVEADGYVAGRASMWPPRREQQLTLTPRAFTIRVTDAESGEPIPDAVPVATGIP